MARLLQEYFKQFSEENSKFLEATEGKFDTRLIFTNLEEVEDPNERYVIEKFRDEMTVKELLTSDDANQLVQPIMTGALLEGVEKESDIAALFPTISVQGTANQAYEFPLVGEIEVGFVNQASPYPIQNYDFTRFMAADTFKLRKYGAIVNITDEMIMESNWDMIAMWLRKAGRAMQRFRNRWIFNEFHRHAHVLYDNSLSDPTVHTTGLGPDGNPNGSLQYMDILKMCMALISSDFNPTHIIMNGLVWPVFVNNEFLGSFGTHQFNRLLNMWKTQDQIDVSDPEGVVRRAFPGLPQVMLSSEAPIDNVNKKYDIFVVDANAMGAMLQAEAPQVPKEEWRDPLREVQNLKVRAIECPAIFNGGRAIMCARNVSLESTYGQPIVVKAI